MFNSHKNVTADGVLITEGLRVFTNELEVGTVVKDADDSEYKCCGEEHSKGQLRVGGGWFTDHTHPETLRCSKGCRHNHWFEIKLDNGGTSRMDGERMGTVFEGRRA